MSTQQGGSVGSAGGMNGKQHPHSQSVSLPVLENPPGGGSGAKAKARQRDHRVLQPAKKASFTNRLKFLVSMNNPAGEEDPAE